MNENIKTFLKAVSQDNNWIEQHKNIADKDEAVAAALAKAAELGISLEAADFEAPEGELSEDELAAVAGGGKCACAVGGGGTADDSPSCAQFGTQDQVCWCVVYGEGWSSEYDLDGSRTYDQQRCECPMVGQGY